MLIVSKAIGAMLFLSVACQAIDVLDELEKRIEAFPVESPPSSQSSPRSPEISGERASIFDVPIASNLAKLISNAIKSQTGGILTGQDKVVDEEATSFPSFEGDTQEEGEKQEENDGDHLSVKTGGDASSSSSGASSPSTNQGDAEVTSENEKVDFAPASAEQFGEIGTGSKLVEYLPDFSDMSLEATNFAGVAGAGAVALMALGAAFAVPVAPVILRRAGTDGWAGLPSWSDLFNWWSSPDPVAKNWADKQQQGYDYSYDIPQTGYYYNDQQAYAYDSTGSGSNNQNNYYEEANVNQLEYAMNTDYANGVDYQAPVPYEDPLAYAGGVRPQQGPRRRNQKPHSSVDGHEYVTLEQLNRIGEESVKYLHEMAKGYTTDDFYAYRDNPSANELRRRRLHTQPSETNGSPQYQPQPSYVKSQQYFTKSYMEDEEDSQDEAPLHHEEGPEGFPHKETFSITQPDSQEDANYKANSPYQYSYDFTNTGIENSQSYQQEDGQDVEQSMYKVSEFPYEFHKE